MPALWSFSLPHKSVRLFWPVSAKAVLLAPDKRVLILRKASGLYDLPGGKLERGEVAVTALRREIQEETGLKAGPTPLLACGMKRRPGLGPRLVMVYGAVLSNGSLPQQLQLSGEHDFGAFLTPPAALKCDLPPVYLMAIARALGRRQPLYAVANMHG